MGEGQMKVDPVSQSGDVHECRALGGYVASWLAIVQLAFVGNVTESVNVGMAISVAFASHIVHGENRESVPKTCYRPALEKS